MMVAEEIHTTFEIDKSSWTKVKLGDVVREVRETVKDPVAEGIERIVGLEHLEPESLHIRTWGTLTDGTTFTKVFRKGQVLFGRRRAYLKKAALAIFDGICSGDITVLEAKKGLLPELLPFLIQNDKFFELAVKNSAGSLSPRAKFADFADYEFLLPPIDQQEQLGQLLWAGDEAVEKDNTLFHKIEVALSSVINFECHENLKNEYESCLLHEIVSGLNAGVSIICKDDKFEDNSIGILKTSSITGNSFDPTEAKVVGDKNLPYLKESLKKGSILINRKNTKQLVGSSKYVDRDYDNLFCPDLIWQISIKSKKALSQYMWYYLSSAKIRQKLSALSSGTNSSMVNISQKDFLNLKVDIPDIDKQFSILKELEKLEIVRNSLKDRISNAKALQKSIINQIF